MSIQYADPGYQKDKQKRYPIDTVEHIRAAWSYINREEDASKYSPADLKKVRAHIIAAWKREIDPHGPPSAQSAHKATQKMQAGHKKLAEGLHRTLSRSAFK